MDAENKDIYELMAKNWSAEIVARSQISVFTGGLLCGRTLANYDARKIGPKIKIRFGKCRIGYPKKVLVEWLRSRCKTEVI